MKVQRSPVHPGTMKFGLSLLRTIRKEAPKIIDVGNGRLRFEWYADNEKIIIEVSGPCKASLSYYAAVL